MNDTNKAVLAIVGVVAGVIFGLFIISGALVASANNTAIRYEQTVKEQKSVIDVQLQRRHDLILSLVSTVEASGKFEKSTLTDVIEMRKSASSGDVEQAMVHIQALAEAYPDIKSVANYTQLMTELSTTENLISEQRKTYNSSVKSYQSYTQSFPSGLFLNLAGYHKQDFSYLEFNTPAYDPNIFKNQ